MECEVCGRQTAKLNIILINGVEYRVCRGCRGLEQKQRDEIPKAVRMERPAPKKSFREPSLENYDFVDEYGTIIRKAREAKGLTLKELGMKLYEKESTLNRVENQRTFPDERLARKLEKFFSIRLFEQG